MRTPRQLFIATALLLVVTPARALANDGEEGATGLATRDEPPPTGGDAARARPTAAVKPAGKPVAVKLGLASLSPEQRALRRHPAIGMRLFVGAGLGGGSLATEGVNTDPYNDHKLLSSSTGSFQPTLALMVQPSRYLQLAAIAELGGGFGSKSYGLLGPDGEWFGFWRAAGALLLSFNIPLVGLNGAAVFAGAGPTVQHIGFADGSLTTVGVRIIAGYRAYEGTLQIDGFLAVDLVSTDSRLTGEPPMRIDSPGWSVGFIVYLGVL
jgi:hypothetical protein